MIVVVPDVLSPAELKQIRESLTDEDFLDGRATAGPRTKGVKQNLQTDRRSERLSTLQTLILAALDRNGLFKTAIAPRRIVPPRFNLYKPGMHYGDHVDNAIMGDAGDPVRIDCSFTLFISGPGDYEGGELIIKSGYGPTSFKLPAGHLVAYPTYHYHEVTPVRSGERLACVSWLQSLIRDPAKREVILDLALASDRVSAGAGPTAPDAIAFLDKARKNLLRLWIEN
jgi:PKHD-type hydroxylase